MGPPPKRRLALIGVRGISRALAAVVAASFTGVVSNRVPEPPPKAINMAPAALDTMSIADECRGDGRSPGHQIIVPKMRGPVSVTSRWITEISSAASSHISSRIRADGTDSASTARKRTHATAPWRDSEVAAKTQSTHIDGPPLPASTSGRTSARVSGPKNATGMADTAHDHKTHLTDRTPRVRTSSVAMA